MHIEVGGEKGISANRFKKFLVWGMPAVADYTCTRIFNLFA